jgi:hypothetical protein
MVNLSIEETSGVDHPAHLHEGWLVMKSAEESEVQRVLDESLTEEDSTMEDTSTTATEEQVVNPTEELTIAKARISELEEALAKASADAEMSEEDKKKKKMEEESSEEMDYMKSAPESVVKMIENFRKQAEEATAELQKERDARADAEAVEKAKGWANLNLDAEKVGPALRRLTNVDAELAKSVEELLASVNAQAESAQIFAEIGKSADFKSGNAYERMTTLAKSAVEEGVAKSFEQALADVATKNPDLYSQYLSEKGA